jgi:RNA polymerase sigma-70 factor (ECF subfamily)
MGEGNERFRGLLEPVYAQALAFARHISSSSSDGDDLFQEALIRALGKLDRLRDEAAFKPWLYRIVITVHRNRCRRAFWKRFIPLGTVASSDEPAAHVSGDYRVADWSPDAAEAARRARDALASLAPAYREAIVLFEIEGWQVDELSTLLGVSQSAVKSRLARGRAQLRAFYEARHQAVPSLSGETS